jgi:hypothetical protein
MTADGYVVKDSEPERSKSAVQVVLKNKMTKYYNILDTFKGISNV